MSIAPRARRKQPHQKRSQRTVDAILGAAAHILKQQGPSRLTTNHIARQANISVGSIYQYFPNKHAILLRLMNLHMERSSSSKPASLNSGRDISLSERIRLSVRWHLESAREDPLLFQRLFEIQHEFLTMEERADFDRYHVNAVYGGLQNHAEEISIANIQTAALVVSNFLIAATQAVTASQPELLHDEEYEAQIVRGLMSYLS